MESQWFTVGKLNVTFLNKLKLKKKKKSGNNWCGKNWCIWPAVMCQKHKPLYETPVISEIYLLEAPLGVLGAGCWLKRRYFSANSEEESRSEMQLCMFVAVTAARCRRCTRTPENRTEEPHRGGCKPGGEDRSARYTHTHRIVPGAEARGTLGIKGSRNRSEYYLAPTFWAEKPTETIQNMKVECQ